jgi:hypothetical protein
MPNLVEQLQIFGTQLINGFGDENTAAEKLETLNGLIAEHPNIFPIITDKQNIEVLNEAKGIIDGIDFNQNMLLNVPKLMALMPLKDKINLYN